MALIIPPGYADIAVEMRANGDPDPWYCTWGVDVSEAGGDITAIGETSRQAWTYMMAHFPSSVQFTGVKITLGQDGGEPVRAFYNGGSSVPGAGNVPKLPQNCALLVDKFTNVGGRKHRGRFFVPGCLTEEAVDNVGMIDAATYAGLNTTVDAIFVELETNAVPTPMVILHNGLPGVDTPDPTPVVNLQAQQQISTQRRRLR